MAKPAATISHFHVCPKVTAKVPHVGGPVIQGSPNVFIGGLPAARVGDSLICVGPPDKIKQGSASVFINGKPAARMGDPTDHGGVIVMGNPTVVIGDQGIVIGGGGVTIGSSVVAAPAAASPSAAEAHAPGPVNGISPASYQQQASAGALGVEPDCQFDASGRCIIHQQG